MSKKTNMQQFDEITARVLVKLYESFPVPLSLDCLSLTESPEMDEFGEISSEAEICMCSLRWLGEEGYIKAAKFNSCYAIDVVLTAKGLTALKASPESLEYKQTLGERLVSAVNKDAINTAVGVVGLVLSGIK